jgi:hypothetical protein
MSQAGHTRKNCIFPSKLKDFKNRTGISSKDCSTPGAPNSPHECDSENVPGCERRVLVRLITHTTSVARFDARDELPP